MFQEVHNKGQNFETYGPTNFKLAPSPGHLTIIHKQETFFFLTLPGWGGKYELELSSLSIGIHMFYL